MQGDLSVTGSITTSGDLTTNGSVTAYDVQLSGGDIAEDFTLAQAAPIEPGTVVVIGENATLTPSSHPYDRKVIGVVSGAGDLQPGIVLDKRPGQHQRTPVAMIGKVYCKVDAQYAAIETGDLLTTSPTPGCAMKAT